ncbi:MAG TPA: lysophospholipid acyltransferase family protein [Polyangiaceae bacterium]|jgi:1-acyl-sn-glycerol-3-phosphate acyltransferase|nr:lysophospholipid acyltransferase family protein [Polyangiaceae bacterium]
MAGPSISSERSAGQGFREVLVRRVLGVCGWRLAGEPPAVGQCVIVFAPHTSNWDFPLLLLVRIAFGRQVKYLAKHTLLRFPFGWFFRWTGAIPVERSESHQLVRQLCGAFERSAELWLALSPEGTRKKTDHWKSGFYHLALAARVPVLLAFVDASRRQCGLGPLLELSGDPERDQQAIAAFYADKRGIVPGNTSEIRWS